MFPLLRITVLADGTIMHPTVDGKGGWIAKINKVNKRDKITDLQFCDGKQSFKFPFVLERFKPLTAPP